MTGHERSDHEIQTPVAKPGLSKRVFPLAATLLPAVLALAAACGSGGGPAGGPRLALDGDAFEVGDIKVGQVVQRSIEFRNEGDAPLKVSIVKVRPAPDADCGCGVEGFQARPGTLEPGGRGELVFKLRAPEGMEKMQDKMLVELESNDPRKPSLTFTLIFNMSP